MEYIVVGVRESDKPYKVLLNGYGSGNTGDILVLDTDGFCLVATDSPEVEDRLVEVRGTTIENPLKVCLGIKNCESQEISE